MQSLDTLLAQTFPVVGVLHLPPLPGAPRRSSGFASVLDAALRDAEALAEGGADGAIVENYGDAPFAKDRVEPHVAAALSMIARAVRRRFGDALVVGVNALRNDALSAVGAAAAGGAAFVRVNVHTGAMLTDQGVIEGRARETLLYRRRVAPDLGIVADVMVKHAVPLAPMDLAQAARDLRHRGGADVLVVTGSGTGRPTDLSELRCVRDAVPDAPVWVGSGATQACAAALAETATGAIVGTALHRDAELRAPLDPDRVRAMVDALRG